MSLPNWSGGAPDSGSLFLQEGGNIHDIREIGTLLAGGGKHALVDKKGNVCPQGKGYPIARPAVKVLLVVVRNEDKLGIIDPVVNTVDLQGTQGYGKFSTQVYEEIVSERPREHLFYFGAVNRNGFPDTDEYRQDATIPVSKNDKRYGCGIA
jgi:hypothetical protein